MYKVLYVLSVFLIFAGCKDQNAPDVSQIKSDVNIVRTETQLNFINKSDLSAAKQKHPAFYKIYFDEILPLYKGNNTDSLFISFKNFNNDSVFNDLKQKVIYKYKDTDKIKMKIDQMYQYMQYYFPSFKHVPNFYTFISEFGYQIFIFEDDDGKDGIAIGLDMFMHPQIDYKMIDPDNTNFSDYITRTWNEDHIAKKVTDLHVDDIVGESPGNRLIDQMVHNGKKLYITDLLLPLEHDSIIHEYTASQLDWCRKNEIQMWSFFFDQNLFYESNPSKIAKYLFPSPQSPDMPPAAPGRTANYLGMQIIKAYMQRYPESSLKDLIEMKDSQLIMEKSKYKPKRK